MECRFECIAQRTFDRCLNQTAQQLFVGYILCQTGTERCQCFAVSAETLECNALAKIRLRPLRTQFFGFRCILQGQRELTLLQACGRSITVQNIIARIQCQCVCVQCNGRYKITTLACRIRLAHFLQKQCPIGNR